MSNRSESALSSFRPPAVPLVCHSPFFNAWSAADRLTDGSPQHWTAAHLGMVGMVRIGDQTRRWMGPDGWRAAEPLEQVSLEVTPTRSKYKFESEKVSLEVEFLSPLLTEDLDLLARPVSYVRVTATPKGRQEIAVYLDATGEWCTNSNDAVVQAARHRVDGLDVLSIRQSAQTPLSRSGDQRRIEWGAFYLASAGGSNVESFVGDENSLRRAFARGDSLPTEDDLGGPRAVDQGWPLVAIVHDFGVVDEPTSATFLLAYDEIFAVEFLGRKLLPYWRKSHEGVGSLLKTAARETEQVRSRAIAFDERLQTALRERGGERYERICSLAFRQSICAHGLAMDEEGAPLFFSKENNSNGCIATVDVTYPSSPLYLYLNNDLMKGMLLPVLRYASTRNWRFDFAPHDVGTYPLANGQVYGGGERSEEDQMPVEESANMILLSNAVCRKDGDFEFARSWWGILTRWNDYLLAKGLDPENQLCTDDFSGHMAHNANLSLKAILAVGAWSQMAEALEDPRASEVRARAQEMAREWLDLAGGEESTKLAFDQPGTYSLKYNLVWDKLFGLNLFPEDLARKEIEFYLTKSNRYGVPLDERSDYAKSDWTLFVAGMAEDRATFDELVRGVYDYLQETPDRVPFGDWHLSKTARYMHFRARSVVGGVFLPMLRFD